MSLSKTLNIYDVVGPIHFCSKVIGLTSFSIRTDNHRNYEGFVSFSNVLCIIIATTWSFFVVARYLFASEVWAMNREYLSTFYESCTTVVFTTDVFISIFVNWWLFSMRDRLISTMDLIKDIDEGLMRLDVPVNHSKHRRVVIIIMAVLNAVNICAAAALYCTTLLARDVLRSSTLLVVADFLSCEFFTMLCTQFILFMLIVKIRYQHINEYLLRHLRRKSKAIGNGSVTSYDVHSLSTIAILHNKLVDLVEHLSYCYAVPVSAPTVVKIFNKTSMFVRLCS